ncbi:ATP-binding protein [Caulobacter sp. NIBR1757]|uniref:hybrid sensor histidine kinase/response regulator n=1 Tax=Caulobacter sp. NIBR1757 TaxID=3016000 RepID=UPI0022F0CE8B|nr:ATP-binding protein [Caulobacter sp. NIBR1757]WGM37782.1 Sensor histidine kinase RcsC [Caulobacter sp. NIBR1757]
MAQNAPEPVDDEGLRAVRSLDLAALRPTIHRVSSMAVALSGAAFAYVVLNEEDHIWHSAFAGFEEGLIDAHQSISLHYENGVWIEDALVTHPGRPWSVGAPYARFYCATPLRLRCGLRIGALCVLGQEPRAYDPAIESRLEDCAALLSEAIERLRAERAREESVRETRSAIALKEAIMCSAPMALAMVDRDLRYVYVNARWCKDTGVPRERAIGAHVGDLFPESYAEFGDTYWRCLEGETSWSDRVRIPMGKGRDMWLRAEVGPWRDGDGKIVGLIALSHDITDVITALDRAERSEQRLKLALEIADVLVYEADFEKRELKVDGAVEAFGSEIDFTFDLIEKDPWYLVHPDDRAGAEALWNQCLDDGSPYRTEHRILGPTGREAWAFSAAEMAFGPDGRRRRLLGVLKNLTERKKSELQVAQARDTAEAASRAKSEFLANMSHELRTPLNGVMGVAAALSRTALTPDQQEMLGLIRTSSQTLEAILSDLLDLARIESGKLDLKTEAFMLSGSLRAIGDLFRPLATEKGLAFDLDIDPSADAWFEGDAVRLRQVTGNLLSNAIKFTNRGSVSVRAFVDQGVMALAVRDTGIGFDDAFKARMFERFEQADGSITRQFGGSGLGLAISSQLAGLMGGDLTAESEPGKGAVFILTLPLAPVAAPETAAADPAPGQADQTRAPRVLLAEDHPVNRRVVQMLLEPAGVELTCVENGALAVEAAAAQTFDLVLMDLQMPVMDGLTAIRGIRAAETSRTPIWALSANALPEHKRASAEAGADGHLTKPVNAQALFEVLAIACGAVEDAEAA